MNLLFALLSFLPLLVLPAQAQDVPGEDAARVTIRALLSVSGPPASGETRMVVNGSGGIVAEADGAVLEIDLAPGNYTVEAVSGLATRSERIRVRPGGGSQSFRVNLRSGILAVRSRSAARMVLMEAEPDVFGEQPILAETEERVWALTVPQGRYRLLVEGEAGRKILDQDVEIVPARREVVTTR
ncbi:MAG: hypothetical protein AAF371_20160 [Pseudomonadota bacterium]